MTDGTVTWDFAYNPDGLRLSRSNDTTTYNYVYNGSQLTAMTVGENTLYFSYDADGTPMSVKYGDEEYYYTSNIQGDVIGIVNDQGQTVVTYAYDAWGNILSTTDTTTDNLGTLNPLRYRGYVYDQETNLYYLQSRHYNPNLGRFINADGYTTTGQGFIGDNMFAYCLNNPVIFADHFGQDAILVVNTDKDNEGFPWFGHIYLYIEDEYGIWYKTEFSGEWFRPWAAKIVTEGCNAEEREEIRRIKANQELKGKRYLYITGDYSASCALALEYKDTKFGGYRLLTNNCLHYVQTVIRAGKANCDMLQSAIENCNTNIPILYLSYVIAISLSEKPVANFENKK